MNGIIDVNTSIKYVKFKTERLKFKKQFFTKRDRCSAKKDGFYIVGD